MKKLFTILVSLVLFLCSCSSDVDAPSDAAQSNPPTQHSEDSIHFESSDETTQPIVPPSETFPNAEGTQDVSFSTGPFLPSGFIQSFPFGSYQQSDALDWFHQHEGYTIESVAEYDNGVTATYQGNVKWYIRMETGAVNADGFLVYIVSDAKNSEEEWRSTFHYILDELNELCGAPTYISNSGNYVDFYYNNLLIKVGLDRCIDFYMYIPQ